MGNDWTPPTPKVISVFLVWETRDNNWKKPHYPSYEVNTSLVGCAYSFEQAERLVREVVERDRKERYRRDLHSVRITQQPVGHPFYQFENLSEYVYDRKGCLIDMRTSFKRGDFCEILAGDKVILGIVQDIPVDSDDCYTVLTGTDVNDYQIESTKIFPPSFKISDKTREKLQRAYDEDKTLWMRLRIANTSAMSQISSIIDELGWKSQIRAPRWIEDDIELEISGVPSFPDGLRLQIDQKKAHLHMDRIRITFQRLAGLHPDGRGYRLKRMMDSVFHKKPVEPARWIL